ncbi:hypothetical protein L7F22_025818 [Adiantum nelumboides]|nr:hypothetical protein [Adiantum nelumboides]
MQEVALDPKTHTRSMKMAMEELFQSRQQEEPVDVESDDSESESYQGSSDTTVAAFDPNKEETQGRKVIDSQMKGEFGNPIEAISYYMVRNAGRIQAANLFWYLEKVCILQKTAYISKEAFAPLYQAEQGVKVDWQQYYTIRCSLQVSLAASSMKTSATYTLMEEGTISGSKRQKLLLGSPTIDVKSPFKVSWKDLEEPDSKADVHQNEGANLLVDKLKGQLKDAKAASLKAEDNNDVVDAVHVEELKNVVNRLLLTLQTLHVVVKEKAPLDTMASALEEIDFTQEVKECAKARMNFVRRMQVKRSIVLLFAPPLEVPPVDMGTFALDKVMHNKDKEHHMPKSKGISLDAMTYYCILKACGTTKDTKTGKRIHDDNISLGLLKRNILLGIVLIDTYAKCGVLYIAHKVLEELSVRDVVSLCL